MRRREFIQRAVTTSGVGLLPMLATPSASRARQASPRRLVVFFTPNGSITSEFFPAGGRAGFRITKLLAPLERHRSRLLLIDGLNMDAARAAPGDPHQTGMGALLTGRPSKPGGFCGGLDCASGTSGWASGISLDQWLGDRLSESTPLPSLELGVRVEGANNRHRLSFKGPNLPVVPDDDPLRVYRRVFGGADHFVHQRAWSIVHRRMQAMVRHAGPHEPMLGSHLEALERSRTTREELGDAASTCDGVDTPPELDPRETENYRIIGELQGELAVAALRCDLTRVVSILWSGAASKLHPRWMEPGISPQFDFHSSYRKNFHSYTHEPYRDTSDPEQRETRNKLLATYQWYARRLADFIDLLASTPDASGAPLIDSTMVLWCTELSDPDVHSFRRMPFVLAGGQNFLQTGRYLRTRGTPHNALLATIAVAMGFDVEGFGHPDFAAPPIWEILA